MTHNPHTPVATEQEFDANSMRMYIRAPDGKVLYAEMFEAMTNMSVFRDGVVLNYFYDETVYPEDESSKIRQRYHCRLRIDIVKVDPSTDAS